ncbi:MAG: ATP-binding cassette domain-containing protein [Zoogloeaceae bacterium]|jgi:lipooligosaccharide transport system ATP-binding protein|nr:ATP-binding cassette domain-containing protein [Zoogloeaceae bacterium]
MNASALSALPLRVDCLRKSYAGSVVVDDLSFALEPGVCFGLLGPNGAGKTTTLKLCLGLAKPDAGVIVLAGEPIPVRAQAARARVGVVPQFDNLDPDFTVAENLIVFGRYFGLAGAAIEARIPWLLEFSGLARKRDARISTLSGGMKRRLTLARALVNDPDIVFLDEPTTGLDPQARRLIWERLKQLKHKGKTLLLTTHFMEEAERLCDTLMIVDQGRKISGGSPRALIERHIEPQVVEVCDETPGSLAGLMADSGLAGHGLRVEESGGTVFLHGASGVVQPFAARLAAIPGLRTVHRAANLEDVFIRLTGRELRD